jgi:hypothetical protein
MSSVSVVGCLVQEKVNGTTEILMGHTPPQGVVLHRRKTRAIGLRIRRGSCRFDKFAIVAVRDCQRGSRVVAGVAYSYGILRLVFTYTYSMIRKLMRGWHSSCISRGGSPDMVLVDFSIAESGTAITSLRIIP